MSDSDHNPLIRDKLVEAAGEALPRGSDLLSQAKVEAIPELGRSTGPVLLEGQKAAEALNNYLWSLEHMLKELCSPYDFRTLLLFSRVCSGLEHFRSTEAHLGQETMLRCQTADYATVVFGNRGLSDQFVWDEYGYPGFGGFSESIAGDVICLHVLAHEYRQILTALLMFTFLREAHREENQTEKARVPPPRMSFTLNGDGAEASSEHFREGVGLFSTEEAIMGGQIFMNRHSSQGEMSPLGWSYLSYMGKETSPVALWAPYADAKPFANTEGNLLFYPVKRGLESFYNQGERYRQLFDHYIGMPPAHLCSILQGIAQIAFDEWDDPLLPLTGTMMVPRDEFSGGKILEKSAEALRLNYPEVHEEADLQDSLTRFIDLASSSGEQNQLSLRALRPAYMLHGEPHHETWIVDFNATMVFRQYLHSLLEITKDTHTAVSGEPDTATGTHDADVRTTIFDFELASYLDTLDGVEATFQEHRRYSDLPNIHPPLSPGEDLEIDLPLRVGSVFVPVQTTTSVLDVGYEEGDYEAFHRRWKLVKDKRRNTDKKYADKLVQDPTSHEFLCSNGITHVLPIVCTPFPEPVVSSRESYWLRALPEELQKTVSEEALNKVLQDQSHFVPRILTPTELYEFLKTTDEAELKKKARRVMEE